MKVQWLGHAAVKLSGADSVVYIDPSVMPYLGEKARDTMHAAEPADIVLVTHEHADHCSTDIIERLAKPGTTVVGPASCRKKLGSMFHEMNPGDTASFGSVHVQAVEAYNVVRHRTPGTPFHPKGTGLGYIVTMDGHSIYHAGDTEPIPEMEQYGPVDVAFLPVDGYYTMSPAEALESATLLRAHTVIPVHFFETDADAVLEATEAVPGISVEILDIGQTYELSS